MAPTSSRLNRKLRLKTRRVGLTAVLPAFVLSVAGFFTSADAADTNVSPARQSEIIYMLRHDCGSCHGMTLKGGLGPSLLPERLAEESREILKATIQHGRPGTPMPPWRGILSEEEIDWLLEVLYRGVPDSG